MGLPVAEDRTDRRKDSTLLARLSDSLIELGYRGLLFPSLRRAGGTNLVVFNANLMEKDSVAVHDPDGRLPKNQASWPDS